MCLSRQSIALLFTTNKRKNKKLTTNKLATVKKNHTKMYKNETKRKPAGFSTITTADMCVLMTIIVLCSYNGYRKMRDPLNNLSFTFKKSIERMQHRRKKPKLLLALYDHVHPNLTVINTYFIFIFKIFV